MGLGLWGVGGGGEVACFGSCSFSLVKIDYCDETNKDKVKLVIAQMGSGWGV